MARARTSPTSTAEQGRLLLLVVSTLMGCASSATEPNSQATVPGRTVHGPTVHIAPTQASKAASPTREARSPACDISGSWKGSGDDDVTSWAWLAKLQQQGHLVRGEFHWSTGEGEAAVETVEGYVRCDRSSFTLDGISIESDWDGLFIPGDYRGTFGVDSIEGRWSVGQPGRFWGTRSDDAADD